ncbi:ferredoxin [Desulfocurvibacter africanus]|uniref:ferredoxin n=1 Tax=Desulfocurvibacter africanus TaxID=873 RepID=UPI00040D3E02|nr:ferredoxin [Desulfocurvibacter africanus]
MAIMINEEECVGCESCVELCPDVFALNEAGDKAMVLAPDSTAECVDEAIENCPSGAISRA